MDIWKGASESAKKERWKALWTMEDLPRPLWFVPATPVLGQVFVYAATSENLSPSMLERDERAR